MTGYEIAIILCIGEAALVIKLYLAYRLIKGVIDNDCGNSGNICCGEE